MKIKVSTQRRSAPAASNLSHDEFLREAHARFPAPSLFMQQFLERYEALITFEAEDARKEAQGPDSQEVDCPACGAGLLLEDIE